MAVRELIVDKDSYVTLEEANDMVANTYLSGSSELSKWNALSDDDKTIVLRNSALALNNLRYKGRKRSSSQVLAFPRVHSVLPGIMWQPFVSQNYDNSLLDISSPTEGGLGAAKLAQVKNAVAFAMIGDSVVAEVNERKALGILSKNRGSISESYDSSSTSASVQAQKGIYNWEETKHILINWISDSVYTI